MKCNNETDYTQMDTLMDIQMDTQMDRQTDRQTGRQNKQTGHRHIVIEF